MKKIYLDRLFEINESTVGRLITPLREHICYTIEPLYLNNKRNVSCIPSGVYDITYLEDGTPSFHYPLYEVENVENRTAILFHRGNFSKDTQGCILPNLKIYQDHGENSEDALNMLICYLGREDGILIVKE